MLGIKLHQSFLDGLGLFLKPQEALMTGLMSRRNHLQLRWGKALNPGLLKSSQVLAGLLDCTVPPQNPYAEALIPKVFKSEWGREGRALIQ